MEQRESTPCYEVVLAEIPKARTGRAGAVAVVEYIPQISIQDHDGIGISMAFWTTAMTLFLFGMNCTDLTNSHLSSETPTTIICYLRMPPKHWFSLLFSAPAILPIKISVTIIIIS